MAIEGPKDWAYVILGLIVFVTFALGGVWVYHKLTWQPSFTVQTTQNVSDGVVMTFVSGTEYRPGQDGQVVVEIRDLNGAPVQSNCSIYVWYPNKTLMLSAVAVQDNSTGNSWINFTTPNIDGVYEYQANCTAKGRDRVMSKSFHVTRQRIKAVTPK